MIFAHNNQRLNAKIKSRIQEMKNENIQNANIAKNKLQKPELIRISKGNELKSKTSQGVKTGFNF